MENFKELAYRSIFSRVTEFGELESEIFPGQFEALNDIFCGEIFPLLHNTPDSILHRNTFPTVEERHR